MAREHREDRRELRHRRRDQDDIGVGERAAPVFVEGEDAIDDPPGQRLVEVRAAAADADDVDDRAGFLERQRARPADESDADDGEPVDPRRRDDGATGGGIAGGARPAHAPARDAGNARASASRKRVFSAGSPTVTRNHAGRP
jgi:hypothetical protein